VLRPLGAMLVLVVVAITLLRAPLAGPLALIRLVAVGATLTAVSAVVSGFKLSMLRGALSPIPRAS